tara:strand:- start:285661 stop:285819 length:159 start_codon:yes stop_codon:yes gene_type:complete
LLSQFFKAFGKTPEALISRHVRISDRTFQQYLIKPRILREICYNRLNTDIIH